MIDEFSTFYVNGFAISWAEIREYWENLRIKDQTAADRIGDPSYSEHACKEIAKILVHELIDVGYFKADFLEVQNGYERDSTYKSTPNVVSTVHEDIAGVDFTGDTDDVIKKAFEELEKKHKEERKKQEERVKFWKEQKSNYVPLPVEKPKEPIQWRKVLGLPTGIILTEEVIKRYFRKAALKKHPDINGGNVELFRELMEARDLAYAWIGLDPP